MAADAVLLVVLMSVAAALGVLDTGIYSDNTLVRAGWLGNDLVTLLIAVPMLAFAASSARRGSARGQLAALGVTAYAFYNYAFYLFGAAFNALFIVYTAIVAVATVGLILGFTSTRTAGLVRAWRARRADRSVGVVLLIVSGSLGAFWLTVSASYVWTSDVPAMVAATGHVTNVTAALDLWLVVVFGAWGGLWLLRGRPWGYAIAVVWSVKGAVYMTALSAATVSAWRAGALADLAQLALWAPIGVACAVSAMVLLRSTAATRYG